MFQLFDLVEKSAKIFAKNIQSRNEPIMYPKPSVLGQQNVKNPYCEEKLIFVKFIKVTQDSLQMAKRCADNQTKQDNQLHQERLRTTENIIGDRYVVDFYSLHLFS